MDLEVFLGSLYLLNCVCSFCRFNNLHWNSLHGKLSQWVDTDRTVAKYKITRPLCPTDAFLKKGILVFCICGIFMVFFVGGKGCLLC